MFLIYIAIFMLAARTCSTYKSVLTITFSNSEFNFNADHLSTFLLCLRNPKGTCFVYFEALMYGLYNVKNVTKFAATVTNSNPKVCLFNNMSIINENDDMAAVCLFLNAQSSICFLQLSFKSDQPQGITSKETFTLFWNFFQPTYLKSHDSTQLEVTSCSTGQFFTTQPNQVITTSRKTTTLNTITRTSVGSTVTLTPNNYVTTTIGNNTAVTMEHDDSNSSDTTVYIVVGVLIGLAVVSSIIIICYFFIRRRQFKLKLPGIFKKKLPIKTLPDLRVQSGTQNMAFTDDDDDYDGYVKPRISSVMSNVESNTSDSNNISLDTNADNDFLEYQCIQELNPSISNSSDDGEKTREYEIKNNSISKSAVDKSDKECNAMEIDDDKEPIGTKTNVESHYNNVKPNGDVLCDQTQSEFTKVTTNTNKHEGHIEHSSNNALNPADVGLHNPDSEQRYSNVSIGKADVMETSAVANDDSVIRIRLDVHSESAAPVDKEPIYYELEEYC